MWPFKSTTIQGLFSEDTDVARPDPPVTAPASAPEAIGLFSPNISAEPRTRAFLSSLGGQCVLVGALALIPMHVVTTVVPGGIPKNFVLVYSPPHPNRNAPRVSRVEQVVKDAKTSGRSFYPPPKPVVPGPETLTIATAPVLTPTPSEIPPTRAIGFINPSPPPLSPPRLPVPAGFPKAWVAVEGDQRHGSGGLVTAFPGARSAERHSGGGGDRPGGGGGFGDPRSPSRHTPGPDGESGGLPLDGVKISKMPKPQYTDLARANGIEGVVRVMTVFTAEGHIRITGFEQSLGYGLDESAAIAVEHIDFTPAQTKDGTPVDQPLIVEVVFRLARQSLVAVTN